MADESLPLARRIAAEIRRGGPLRFDRFQSAALYDPEAGYYERPGRVGRAGDFVTGASWHPAFARCLARVAGRLRDEIGEPLDVVDVGAGEGELLGFLSEALPDRGAFRLLGVEPSAARRAAAARRVPEAAFVPDAGGIPPRVRGLVVAYELFDALPVRALRFAGEGRLAERCVTTADDGRTFDWVERPCGDGDTLLSALAARGVSLAVGQLLEVRPGAFALAARLGAALGAGLLLVFDYGAPARALYGPSRPNGTLEAFLAHRVTREVLADPGSRDLTAWVDFTEIQEAVAAAGLRVDGLVSQSRFLLASGIGSELERDDPGTPGSAERAAERNAVAKLFVPGGMGESLRVVVSGRGVSAGPDLVRFPV